MKIARKVFKVKRSDIIYIIPFGDIHYDAADCDKIAFHKHINWWTERRNVYGIGMGDYLDFMSPSNRMMSRDLYDTSKETLDSIAEIWCNRLVKALWPVKKQLLGLLEGHHFHIFSFGDYAGKTSTEYICDRLGVPYLGWLCLYRLVFKRGGTSLSAVICASHGKGAANSAAGALKGVENMALMADADIYLQGHQHKKVASRGNSRLALSSKDKLVYRTQIFARTGTFLRSYNENIKGTYVEQRLLPPSDVGVVKISIQVKENQYNTIALPDYMDQEWKKSIQKYPHEQRSMMYLDMHVSE